MILPYLDIKTGVFQPVGSVDIAVCSGSTGNTVSDICPYTTKILQMLAIVHQTTVVFWCVLQIPSEKLQRAGKVLRNAILSRAPHMIRDRKYHLKTYR